MRYIAEGLLVLGQGFAKMGQSLVLIITGRKTKIKNPNQNTNQQPTTAEQQAEDARKLAEDWQKIGDDMRKFWQ